MVKLNFNISTKTNRGRPGVPVLKQMCIFLWLCGTTETLRSIGDRFNVTISTVHKTVRRVSNALLRCLMLKTITWPTGSRVNTIVSTFKRMAGFVKDIGAIDRSHIPIQGQGEHNEAYINRKEFPSVVLQAVCDHELNFTDCFVGWPGSVHDARVFKNSPLCNSIQNNPFEIFPNGTHLLDVSLPEMQPTH